MIMILFWKDVKTLNSCKSIQTNIIDGITGESNITNFWKSHVCNILNAIFIDIVSKIDSMEKLQNMKYTEAMTVTRIDVSHLISQLKCGKAAGSDNMCAEYFKFSHDKLNVLLSMCFTLKGK